MQKHASRGLSYQEYDARDQCADTHDNIGEGESDPKRGQAGQDQVDGQENAPEVAIEFHILSFHRINRFIQIQPGGVDKVFPFRILSK